MKFLIYILFAFVSLNVSAQWEKTGWQCGDEALFKVGRANGDSVATKLNEQNINDSFDNIQKDTVTQDNNKQALIPCRSTLKLQFTLEKQCAPKIKIVNVYGLPYYNEELPVMQKGVHIHDINVTEFRPGTYYLEMQCGDKVFRNKYIIER